MIELIELVETAEFIELIELHWVELIRFRLLSPPVLTWCWCWNLMLQSKSLIGDSSVLFSPPSIIRETLPDNQEGDSAFGHPPHRPNSSIESSGSRSPAEKVKYFFVNSITRTAELLLWEILTISFRFIEPIRWTSGGKWWHVVGPGIKLNWPNELDLTWWWTVVVGSPLLAKRNATSKSQIGVIYAWYPPTPPPPPPPKKKQ